MTAGIAAEGPGPARTVVDLWLAQERPAVDGLFRADGSAWAVTLAGPGLSRFSIGEPLSLAALLTADPDWLTSADAHPQGMVELPDASGYVCCGDGSLGSEGFIARLDHDRNLVWLMSLLDSNPFERAEVSGSLATFTNNLGNTLTLDLSEPHFASTYPGR